MPDAYATALALLSRRELSERQLRERLARRGLDEADIEDAVGRLLADGTLSDRRVAVAAARLEGAVRHRGRARALQKLLELGIDRDTAEAAVAEVFAELDESTLLDRALERRLRGRTARTLDERARSKLVRSLAAQGFAIEAILKKLARPKP
jgi:regulatory protein